MARIKKKWFVTQVKPNSYELAKRNLERQGVEVFLPEMNITQRKNNKFLVKNVYVFPGYIFISIDEDVFSWTKINNTYGVSKILAFNNRPAEVSSDIIMQLKNKYKFNYIYFKSYLLY